MTPTSLPYDPDRRSALVDKWADRALSLEEAEELLRYLEADLEEADSEEDEQLLSKAVALLRAHAAVKRHSAKRRMSSG